MEIKQLEYFRAIVDEGNVSAAAREQLKSRTVFCNDAYVNRILAVAEAFERSF